MHSLGKNAEKYMSKEDVLRECIKKVKKVYPDWIPLYNRKFFKGV